MAGIFYRDVYREESIGVGLSALLWPQRGQPGVLWPWDIHCDEQTGNGRPMPKGVLMHTESWISGPAAFSKHREEELGCPQGPSLRPLHDSFNQQIHLSRERC